MALRLVPSLFAAAALTVAVRDARACGAAPPPFWTLDATSLDSDGTVPTDGAILFTAHAWPLTPDGVSAGSLSTGLRVLVRDAAGALMPGTVTDWLGGSVPKAAWTPNGSLPAGVGFTLEAEVSSEVARPPFAVGATDIAGRSFATSDGPAPPLRLEGPLTTRFESYDQPQFGNCGPCGDGCKMTGTVHSLALRLTIPTATGGFAPDGYRAWVWLTDDQPKQLPDGPGGGTEVNLGMLVALNDHVPTPVTFAVPDEAHPYAPCITMRVFDPAGHHIDPTPICQPTIDVRQQIAAIDSASGAGGCALAGTSGGDADALSALWATLAVAVAVRSLRRGRGDATFGARS